MKTKDKLIEKQRELIELLCSTTPNYILESKVSKQLESEILALESEIKEKDELPDEPLYESVKRLKRDVLKKQEGWNYPNEIYIECQGMLSVCDQVLEWMEKYPDKEKDEPCKHTIFTTHTGDYCYCLDCESIFLSQVSFPLQQEKDKCIIANHNFISKDGYLCCTKCKVRIKQESYSEYFARTLSSSRHQENDRKDEPKMTAREYHKCSHPIEFRYYDKEGNTRCSSCHAVVE